MKRRLGALLALTALAGPLSGCMALSKGELSNGGFEYVCGSGTDVACDGSAFAGVPGAIAVGARFQLGYAGRAPSSDLGTIETVSVVSASPALLASSDGGFVFNAPATVAVLGKSAGGKVADFIHVRGEAIDHLAITDDLGGPVSAVALVDTATIEATPRDAADATLAGSVAYAWSSSDEDVVGIGTTFKDNAVTLLARKSGTAVVTVDAQGAVAQIAVTVESAP